MNNNEDGHDADDIYSVPGQTWSFAYANKTKHKKPNKFPVVIICKRIIFTIITTTTKHSFIK